MDPQQTPTEPQATPPVTPPPAPQPDQAAQYWQGQADKTAHENHQLRAQLEQMKQSQVREGGRESQIDFDQTIQCPWGHRRALADV